MGYSPWGREESDTTEQLHYHLYALEKEMATHSSVLAWRLPGTGEAWWAAVYGVTQSRTQLKGLCSRQCILECIFKVKSYKQIVPSFFPPC